MADKVAMDNAMDTVPSRGKGRSWRDAIADSPLDALREEVLGDVASTDHRIDVSMFFRCFTGEEVVDALLAKGLAASQSEAEGVCQKFVLRGVMRPVRGNEEEFQPSQLYCYVGRKETMYHSSTAALEGEATALSARRISISDFAIDEVMRGRSESRSFSTDSETLDESFDANLTLGQSIYPSDEDDLMHGVRILVMGLTSPPRSLRGLRATHYFVRIRVIENSLECDIKETRAQRTNEGSAVMWMEFLNLGFNLFPSSKLEISLVVQHRRTPEEELGRVEVTLQELMARPVNELILCSKNGDRVLVGKAEPDPVSVLRVGLEASSIPPSWGINTRRDSVASSAPKTEDYERHLFIMTRGTRGDIQPFIALARALANNYNWLVTICTELRYKSFVEAHTKGLERGAVQFRVSGGDTQRRIDSKVARWAIQRNSIPMQHIMMAYSEVEFFDSEAAIYHHARKLKPDYLLFGFTLTHVAMIISEALQIPLLGLVLQPTCIPSVQYPPLHFGSAPVAHGQKAINMCRNMINHVRHVSLTSLKLVLENQPFTGGLARMRYDRGLQPMSHLSLRNLWDIFQGNTMMQLQEKKVPLIVPINQVAFGGKPADWSTSSTVLTNFIFLRGQTIPELQSDTKKFIDATRARGGKLVVLAFSSMPVKREQILSISVTLATECKEDVAVIALMGEHAYRQEDFSMECPLERRVLELIAQNRMHCLQGAPYDRLFAEMDLIVSHGGLGATAEILMAGVPVIVTGVLLFDQRFWGRRCHSLGIGPHPVHINDFPSVCTALVDKALEPDCMWRHAAQELSLRIKASMNGDATGVNHNAACIHAMARFAPVFTHDGSKSTYKFYRDRKSSKTLPSRLVGTDNFVVRTVQNSVSAFYNIMHYGLYTATYFRSKVFGYA